MYGDVLREARKRAGVTQADVARVAQVAPATVGYWEQTGNIPADRRPVLAAYLREPALLNLPGVMFDAPLSTALAWALEELPEAQAAAERLGHSVRRGHYRKEDVDQLVDLINVITTVLAGLVREYGACIHSLVEQNRRKLRDRGYLANAIAVGEIA